ncbi:arylsulfatase [Verrucomicrobiaceae bacterium N1E253]|uniref:Arylsulfatase n=1 Tax=Oceaniferula marina TaxID=2748318 RepID=A0A851GK08_9BACT|nr:arylsulfatase [Oceaniferula marina]NWK55427.1 arylsulfatase [Oceaniferula marina]
MAQPLMTLHHTLLIFLTTLSCLSLTHAKTARQDTRPNIIIMMVDDLGYSDFGCYGSEIQTPNIDSLASNGLRFSSFYNTAKCHSSRVSLLTGLYSDQAGDSKLSRGVTIAEVLGKAGYRTAMVGKWHLTKEPTDRGFEKYFGHLSGATNFFKGDKSFRLNGQKWDDFGPDFYTTDANITFATRFLDETRRESPDKPFFLYIAHNAPHYPLQVKKEDYDKYRGIYDTGWDKIRAKRFQKQRDMKLIPDGWKLAPRPELVPAWSKLSDEDKQWDTRRMMAFAGMVDRIDQTTGSLVNYLKQNQLFDNTLILICSDNGACPFDRTKGKDKDPWDPESYWCYDTGWSHVGNTPFRLHKQNQHAGGISSPLIAHWPKGITAKPGSVTHQPGHLIDFMATCIDLADTQYPTNWPDIELQALEGKSLDPIFKGKQRAGHKELFFRYSSNRAIIQGDYKLVTHRASQWELYHITNDGTEMHNLASSMPEKVKTMAQLWHQIAKKKGQLKGKTNAPVSGKTPPRLKKSGVPENKGKQKK